jgi:hypothetical protein
MRMRTQVCLTVSIAVLLVCAAAQAFLLVPVSCASLFACRGSFGCARRRASVLVVRVLRAQVCLSMRRAILVV